MQGDLSPISPLLQGRGDPAPVSAIGEGTSPNPCWFPTQATSPRRGSPIGVFSHMRVCTHTHTHTVIGSLTNTRKWLKLQPAFGANFSSPATSGGYSFVNDTLAVPGHTRHERPCASHSAFFLSLYFPSSFVSLSLFLPSFSLFLLLRRLSGAHHWISWGSLKRTLGPAVSISQYAAFTFISLTFSECLLDAKDADRCWGYRCCHHPSEPTDWERRDPHSGFGSEPVYVQSQSGGKRPRFETSVSLSLIQKPQGGPERLGQVPGRGQHLHLTVGRVGLGARSANVWLNVPFFGPSYGLSPGRRPRGFPKCSKKIIANLSFLSSWKASTRCI